MHTHASRSERGIALIAVLLLMMLVAAVLAGFASVLMNEQRMEKTEQDRLDAFYAAHGALEKITADLGSLFAASYSPSAAQIAALTATAQRPVFTGVSYPTTSEGSGYAVNFTADSDGNPASSVRSITIDPYAGFTGLVTTYTLAVTAQTVSGGEARLERQLQTVGIPIFQFGIFSESDLAFEPGPTFTFTGRVHTNGNLYLGAAESLLKLTDKVTAVGSVVRAYLSTGDSNTYGDNTWVMISTKAGTYRALQKTEGSVVGDVGSSANSKWTTLSTVTYNGRILSGSTGAQRLDLPLVEDGAAPIELIRRPPTTEATTSTLYGQRYFAKASLRILLSDTSADITGLPSVTSTAPIALTATLPTGYTASTSTPPFALADSTATGVLVPDGTPLLGGYLKIEKQTSSGTWVDVTLEILNLGIAGPQQNPTTCTATNANAVLRLQRLADSSSCTTTAADLIKPRKYVAQTLFDAREGKLVDVQTTSQAYVQLGGVIHYIELDVTNLSKWFKGTIGTTGTSAIQVDDGYVVYFSDRRGNRNAAGIETGEYGFEDFVMTSSSQTAPNGTLDTGEDLNASGTLETYGATYAGTYPLTTAGAALTWTSPLGSTVRPYTNVNTITVDVAKRNPARFFRRALKLTNGTGIAAAGVYGLTIATENPMYVQGNYNATAANFSTNSTSLTTRGYAACSLIADAITMLSINWTDYKSFAAPYESNSRVATTTYYRFASITGKGIAFNEPFSSSRAGSDGGVNNYARFLENWNNVSFHFKGSMVSLWYNRQAVGPFRNATSSGGSPINNNAYYPPDRDIQFDTDFLTMSCLPPATPMFRDINVLGFTQVTTVPTS
jgi:hypothetical protein